MDSFASACKQCGINLGRFATKGCTIAATELFLELRDASKQFLDQIMTIVEVIGQLGLIARAGVEGRFGMNFVRELLHCILPYKHHK